MKHSSKFPTGSFKAIINDLRKKDGRYTLFLSIDDMDISKNINIDIHDSICETAGISDLSLSFISRLRSSLPSNIRINNYNGYWKIENESQVLSDSIAKAI